MHPVHYTTLSCNLYILSNAAIYEMLLTYKHVMLVINLWCIRCMIRFYHACLLYILSTATVCFYPWCIQCILAMLLPVDSFKVLRDVVLHDAWFTCYRSTLLILYLRYIPLIYVACSTCYQYIMILIQLGLHVTNIATNNLMFIKKSLNDDSFHVSIYTGNDLYRFFYILEVVCAYSALS